MNQSKAKSTFSICALLLVTSAACSDDDPTAARPRNQGRPSAEPQYATASVLFGDDSNSTYVNVLRSLDEQDVDPGEAREFPGWADLWVHEGRVFVADGEAPTITRFSVDARNQLIEDGRISFANTGLDTAAFWTNLFVSPTKAYLFVIDSREVVIWNPSSLEIEGSIDLPELKDREGDLRLQVPTTDRSSVVRGDRAYVPTLWANWEDYKFSEESIILVFDLETDRVIDTISVPCPNLNVATVDDAGDIYFSNWTLSIPATLLYGHNKACAVRMRSGSDSIDEDWALTFADVTEGREAAALRFIGDGKALMSVFHDEDTELSPETDPDELASGQTWRFWMLDLESLEAAPFEGLGAHSGGYYSTRIDDRSHLFVPSADYGSTEVFELFPDGSIEPRWETTGWATRLFRVR